MTAQMMETESVSAILVYWKHLTLLSPRDSFIEFSHREKFKTYLSESADLLFLQVIFLGFTQLSSSTKSTRPVHFLLKERMGKIVM
jgi:hypothetical protein